ncbi:MAG: SdrD B-like domain-containing protein [Acidimicrobiales bacterium]
MGDTVFFDIDGTETDGSLDAGDAPLPGIGVTVVWAGANGTFGDSDDFTATLTTQSAGDYLLTGLPHGSYTVTVDDTDLPTGLTATTYDADGIGTASVSATVLDATTPDDLTQDFTYTGETDGRIGDTVWFDHDGDGVQAGTAEVGFSGVTVTLVWFGPDDTLGGGDDVTQTTVTAADGTYLFDHLPDGVFTVTVDSATLPAGLVATFDADGVGTLDTSTVTLSTVSRTRLDQDFGYRGVGSLGDLVWFDIDGSATATPDGGEPGIDGADVTVTWTNPQGSDVMITTTTASGGTYLVPNLPDGSYSVVVDPGTLPGGLVATFDADGVARLMPRWFRWTRPHLIVSTRTSPTPASAPSATPFGSTRTPMAPPILPAAASSMVRTSPGRIDIVVTFGGFDGVLGDDAGTLADESADDLVYNATTDANGEWLVAGLPYGPYSVDVVAATLPSGVTVATFDADGVGSVHVSTTALDGATPDRLDQDFSYTGAGSVGDTVWFDRDGDGVFDSDEVALGGIDVTLTYTGPDGSLVTVVDTTDTNGQYGFRQPAVRHGADDHGRQRRSAGRVRPDPRCRRHVHTARVDRR